MFQQFPNPQSLDVEIWVLAVAAILAEYSEPIILGVTDPKTGMMRVTKWLPVAKEVYDECERRVGVVAAMLKSDAAVDATLRRRREDHADTPRNAREGFEELKARYGENWGIGKFDKLDRLRGDEDPAKEAERKRVLYEQDVAKNRQQIARMYEHEGVEPHEITSADSAWQAMPVSPSLVKLLHGLDPRAPLSHPRKLREII